MFSSLDAIYPSKHPFWPLRTSNSVSLLLPLNSMFALKEPRFSIGTFMPYGSALTLLAANLGLGLSFSNVASSMTFSRVPESTRNLILWLFTCIDTVGFPSWSSNVNRFSFAASS